MGGTEIFSKIYPVGGETHFTLSLHLQQLARTEGVGLAQGFDPEEKHGVIETATTVTVRQVPSDSFFELLSK